MDELKINDICKSMTAMTVDIAVIKNEMMHTNTKIDEGIDRLEKSVEEIKDTVMGDAKEQQKWWHNVYFKIIGIAVILTGSGAGGVQAVLKLIGE